MPQTLFLPAMATLVIIWLAIVLYILRNFGLFETGKDHGQ